LESMNFNTFKYQNTSNIKAASSPVPEKNSVDIFPNINLEWQGNFGRKVSYEVWLGESKNSLVNIGIGNLINRATYSISVNLTANTKYWWRIKTIYGREEIWSKLWSFTTNNKTLPVEISSFTVIKSSENFVQIDWETMYETNLLSYNIHRNIENVYENSTQLNDSLIAAVNSPLPSVYHYIDKKIENDTLYYYWLESLDLDGNAELLGPVSIKIKIYKQATPEFKKTNFQLVFPNLFNPIKFFVKENEIAKFQIFNTKGQIIKSYSILHSGSYEIRCNGTNNNKFGSFNKIQKMLLLK
jgi:hypothetical protein